MIGRSFIEKTTEKFSEHNPKILSENPFHYREIVKKRKYFIQL